MIEENIFPSLEELVSVVIVTYNSSTTVVETLESIKEQTYQNIELIVTDDCSSDNTIEVVKKWLETNACRFVRTQIVTTKVNTGIAGNNNRGIKSTTGKWVKPIAGDDCLLPLAISANMAYIASHPNVRFVISKCQAMGDIEAAKKCAWFNSDKYFLKLSHFERKILLCYFSFVPASATFINKESFLRLGGYDERIQLVDDWPFWLKVFHSNEKVGYLSEETIKYRFSDSSLSQPGKQLSERYMNDYKKSLLVAKDYLNSHSILVRWHARTFDYKNKKHTLLAYLLYFTNIFNPYLYLWIRMKLKISF